MSKPKKCPQNFNITLLINKFWGLRSLCKTLLLWQNARPLKSWYLQTIEKINLQQILVNKMGILHQWLDLLTVYQSISSNPGHSAQILG
jgi:hypothetical protein